MAVSKKMSIFAKSTYCNIKAMINDIRISEHSAHYLPCFIDGCSRHETCLHWLTGQNTTQNELNILCVNPMNPEVKADRCPLYRENRIVRYGRGMMNLLDKMPAGTGRAVRTRLISLLSRKIFYEIRNGKRPVSPDQQQQIAAICQEYGWTADLQFDSWEEDYQW